MDAATRELRLEAALQQLAAGEHQRALPLLEALRDQVLPEIAAASAEDESLRARVLLALARAYPRQGRAQEAVRAGCESLLWFEQLGDLAGASDAHSQLALSYAQLGVGREALDQALQALDLARQLQDRDREAWALLRVGNAHAALDNPVQARELTQQAREMAQQRGLSELDFACLSNQAYFTIDELEFARFDGDSGRSVVTQAMAELLSQQSLEVARAQRNPYREAIALSNLNEALLHGSEWTRVAEHIELLERIATEHDYTTLQLYARLQRAKLTAAQGGWQSAIAQAETLLREAAGTLLPRQRRALLQLLYECHKAWGDATRALAYLEELVRLERQSVRDTQLVHTQLLLIREEVQQAVNRAERAVAEAQQLQQRLQDVDREAREDALTGLPNRRHAEQVLQDLAGTQCLRLALLDLDHFKLVNDRFGHACGDAVLRELGSLLQSELPAQALVARWGGEEFLLALPGCPASAMAWLDARRQRIAGHDWERLATGLQVTASIGSAKLEPPATDWQEALARADAALYRAKAAGRNRVVADD